MVLDVVTDNRGLVLSIEDHLMLFEAITVIVVVVVVALLVVTDHIISS